MVRSLAFVLFAVLLVPMLAQEPILPPGIKDTQPPKDIPPTPEEAARRFKVPPGFEVTLFAGEPDVRQPIAMTFDDRGRLWVAECYSYPNWTETGQSVPPPLTKGGQGGLNAGSAATPPNPPFARGGETGQDRILIFEDADGDGRFDKRTVFMDKLPNLTGILWGHGGIWACTAPNLVFIPDKDGDDRPDGPPQIVLDGWSTKTKHNIVNSLAWGPDGWLYGCHGILAESLVGQPGDPPEKRTRMNCGVWRFRPEWKERQEVPQKNPRPVFLPPPLTKGGPGGVAGSFRDDLLLIERPQNLSATASNPPYPPFVRGGGKQDAQRIVAGGRFEVVAHGTTNPWGLDWNEHGEAFFTNCVIGHLWHLIPGAHYKRMYGLDYNPHVYELIDATSDHLHWGGGEWTQSRGGKGAHSDAGGGHAHSGAMVYLGDNWPDEYRGNLFTCNIHGNRLNRDQLVREGCGYTGKHLPDFMTSDNEWFRGVALTYGPDGGVYVADWCDHGECHDDDGVHRSSGRIYKVIYRPTHKWPGEFDLSKKSDAELVELLKHKNAWWARQAQRLVAERAAAGKLAREVIPALVKLFDSDPDVVHKLRAMWALFGLNEATPDWLATQLGHAEEYVRAWAVRLLCEGEPPSDVLISRLAQSAEWDKSGLVRLHLASALQKLPVEKRTRLAFRLWGRVEDADDPVLPLMLWYGMEPWVAVEKKHASTAIGRGRIGKITRFLIRRVCEDTTDPAPLDGVIFQLLFWDAPHAHVNGLQGLREALRGRKSVPMPKQWPDAERKLFESPRQDVRDLALFQALVFDSPGAHGGVRKLLNDSAATADRRAAAMQALVEKGAPDLAPVLLRLLGDAKMRGSAIRSLAAYAHADTPAELLNLYPALPNAEKQDAIATLAARPKFAHALLDAVEQKRVPRGDLSTFTARQIQDLGDKELSAKLARVWGELRQTSAEKKQLLEQYKARLGSEVLAKADLANGRRVFEKTCASCHRLHGQGGTVGPDLTGSNRTELHYVLENTLDPSASVGRDYQLTNFLLHDGRLVPGIVVEETARAVTVQTANERLVLALSDIEQRKTAKISMMPEGLLEKLTAEEVRDLVGYLREKQPAAR